MADLPKRVWSWKSQVYSWKKPIWEKDWKVGVYSPNFEEVEGGETYAINRWEDLPDTAELQVYGKNAFEETDIGTFEDWLEATYTFMNYDESVLKTGKVKDGETPVAPADPTKPATAQYTYTFSGWNPAVWPITKNTSYIAQYTSTVNTYTITFKDYDNSVISEQTLEYWASPVVPSDPTRSGYRFTGWSPAVATVTQDATYTAQYVAQYTVSFVANDNSYGTVSPASVVADAGSSATTSGNTMTIGWVTVTATPESGYLFDSWDTAISSLNSNVTVTAIFVAEQTWWEVTIRPTNEYMGYGVEAEPSRITVEDGTPVTQTTSDWVPVLVFWDPDDPDSQRVEILNLTHSGYALDSFVDLPSTITQDTTIEFTVIEESKVEWEEMDGQYWVLTMTRDSNQGGAGELAFNLPQGMSLYDGLSGWVECFDPDYTTQFNTHLYDNPDTWSQYQYILQMSYTGSTFLDNNGNPVATFYLRDSDHNTIGQCKVYLEEPAYIEFSHTESDWAGYIELSNRAGEVEFNTTAPYYTSNPSDITVTPHRTSDFTGSVVQCRVETSTDPTLPWKVYFSCTWGNYASLPSGTKVATIDVVYTYWSVDLGTINVYKDYNPNAGV